MVGPTTWLGIGVVTAGVSLQALVGAGVAWADGDATTSGNTPSSVGAPAGHSDVTPAHADSGTDTESAAVSERPESGAAAGDESAESPGGSDVEAAPTETEPAELADPAEPAEPAELADPAEPVSPASVADDPVAADGVVPSQVITHRRDRLIEDHVPAVDDSVTPGDDSVTPGVSPAAEVSPVAEPAPSSADANPVSRTPEVALTVASARRAEADEESVRTVPTATAASLGTATLASSTASGYGFPIISAIVGFVFGVLTALERLATGPARVPPGSTVTVQSSSLQLTDSRTVPADWYFPAVSSDGGVPQRMIFLAHGFFAIGPMYSYLAARLAEDTNSIVVVPSFTSNPLVADGLWINGPALQPVVADLFTGERAALTASALAAGYAERYGLDGGDAVLPSKFALSGHSAGGSLVTGAATWLVANGAVDNLVGLVLLDAVTTGNAASDALTLLDAYGGSVDRYIPVRNIGSPPNLWNFITNINGSLSAVRPDRYNGIVLAGGTHADAIQGASPLIQCVLNVLVGTPTAQNTAAVQELADTWLNEWFAGYPDIGDHLLPGSTILIPTPAGPATGTVIGMPPSLVASTRETGTALAAHAVILG